MSSSKRPGTVDYSKWEHFEDSDADDSDSGEEEHHFDAGVINNNDDDDDGEEEEDEEDNEEESSSWNDNNKRIIDTRTASSRQRSTSTQSRLCRMGMGNHPPPSTPELPSVAALQRAWNTDLTTITRPCSNCFQPNAQFRCRRCQIVRYCDVSCQSSYHPIHKLECIDANAHQKYWGMFDDNEKSGVVVDDFVALKARRSSKRREYIITYISWRVP